MKFINELKSLKNLDNISNEFDKNILNSLMGVLFVNDIKNLVFYSSIQSQMHKDFINKTNANNKEIMRISTIETKNETYYLKVHNKLKIKFLYTKINDKEFLIFNKKNLV